MPKRVIYSSDRFNIVFFTFSIPSIIFLFWLALSTPTTAAVLIATFAIIWSALAAAMIKKPFKLVLSDKGLLVVTIFADHHYAWDSFQSFALGYADPITKQVVFKVKPGVDSPRVFRAFSPRGYDGSLFPYFQIKPDRIIQILRKYQAAATR